MTSFLEFPEKRLFEELINMVNAQVHEMKSMSNAIQKLETGKELIFGVRFVFSF